MAGIPVKYTDLGRYYWTVYCRKERNEAIFEAERIINNHAYITDFNWFSDISINLRIETTSVPG